MKKVLGKKVSVRSKRQDIELDSAEVSLITEAVKEKLSRVREERFYRQDHPDGFYEIYLQRYSRILDKLNIRVPRVLYVKMPKF